MSFIIFKPPYPIHFLYISLLLSLISILNVSCNQGVKRIPSLKNNYSEKQIITKIGSCKVASDEIDRITGLRETKIERELFFSYTHDKLKKYFPTEAFLLSYAFVSRIENDKYFLNIHFELVSNRMEKSYQGISDNTYLKILLINGEQILINNIMPDQGKIISGGRKLYQSMYPLSKKDISKLGKFEIDQIGVSWNGGFESYPVHDVDLVLRHLLCFNQIID